MRRKTGRPSLSSQHEVVVAGDPLAAHSLLVENILPDWLWNPLQDTRFEFLAGVLSAVLAHPPLGRLFGLLFELPSRLSHIDDAKPQQVLDERSLNGRVSLAVGKEIRRDRTDGVGQGGDAPVGHFDSVDRRSTVRHRRKCFGSWRLRT